ncbi:MAG: beta-galactosidase [Micromonosporaceae bacterium]
MVRSKRFVRTLTLTAVVALAVPGTTSATPSRAWGGHGGSSPGSSLAGPDVAVPHHDGQTFDLDAGWRFALVNSAGVTDPTGAFADAASPGYDDSAWRTVSVPHDWSIELNPTAGPATNSGTGFYQGGLGWYRKTFTLPASLAGKHLSVEFDGVYMDCEVYLNGTLLGVHHYGYTGFSLDLAGAHADGRTPDVLAVKVRNAIPSSRWYSGSGIYRNVRLVATDPVHVQRLGMAVTTPGLAETVAAGYGTVHIATTVATTGGTAADVRVTSVVRDASGREVGRATGPVTTGEAPVTAALDVRVAHPHLWDVTDPYLYSVTTRLAVDGATVDSYTSRMGLRWTRFDPQGGFFLNGRGLRLQGVNLHHDQGAIGSAVNHDALARQMKIMKSMGVNALRTSHNPPAPELVQVCEELGIVMMVEAFDVWNVRKVTNDYARFFNTDGDTDIGEMVLESRNSPAVIMWSIGNEIPNSGQASGVPIARRLIDDVRALDASRPVVLGSDKYRGMPAPGSALEQVLLMLDGVGLNYNTAGSIDALHARYPQTFFFESESSSETSTRGRYDQPEQLNTGEDRTPGQRAASSYDNNLASWTMSGEYSLKKDRDRPWYLGEFLWSGLDYIGEPTPFNVFPVKASFFGAVDTAGFAKDQYYLFRSQWTTEPMVHLLPMDWTNHSAGEPVQVWAYANVDTVELFLNGRSVGTRHFDHKVTADGRPYLETTEPTGDDKNVTSGAYPGSYTGSDGTAGHLHLAWSVPFQPGRLVAVARRGNRVVASDEVDTAAAPAAIRLSADRRVLTADGRSLAFVTAEVVDRHGVLAPQAENLLQFAVTGGRLVGVDNGRQESAESYKAAYRTAFRGKALAIVTPTGGRALTVTATAPGLRTGTATVRVTPADRHGGTAQGAAPATWFTPGTRWGCSPPPKTGSGCAPPGAPEAPVPATPPGASGLTAGASFSGSDATGPASMVDGVTDSGGWSNAYTKSATALLPSIGAARARDWVSLSWPAARSVAGITAWFTTDAGHSRPASVQVSYWDGQRWRAATGTSVAWAAGSNQPTSVTFDAVATTSLRLDLTSGHPEAPDGFLEIAELAPAAT